jgi:hypothetical protein
VALPDRPEMRIGDDERNRVLDDLRVHFAAGRLNLTEFEDRAAATLQATTVGDLVPLLSDLPDLRAPRRPASGPPVRLPNHPQPARGQHPSHDDRFSHVVRTWLSLAILFNVIWLLTGGLGDYYWPVWPMFGTGIPVLFSAMHRRGRH